MDLFMNSKLTQTTNASLNSPQHHDREHKIISHKPNMKATKTFIWFIKPLVFHNFLHLWKMVYNKYHSRPQHRQHCVKTVSMACRLIETTDSPEAIHIWPGTNSEALTHSSADSATVTDFLHSDTRTTQLQQFHQLITVDNRYTQDRIDLKLECTYTTEWRTGDYGGFLQPDAWTYVNVAHCF